MLVRDQRNSRVGKALALNVAEPDLTPGIGLGIAGCDPQK